jgi:hypothetical protein
MNPSFGVMMILLLTALAVEISLPFRRGTATVWAALLSAGLSMCLQCGCHHWLLQNDLHFVPDPQLWVANHQQVEMQLCPHWQLLLQVSRPGQLGSSSSSVREVWQEKLGSQRLLAQSH